MQQNMVIQNDARTSDYKAPASHARATDFSRKLLVCTLLCAGAAIDAKAEEIVFTDSQAAVLQTDLNREPAIVSSGTKLMQPFGIAVGRNELFVSDTGCLGIVGINRQTSEQRVVSCGGALGVPFGIALEQGGQILVANGQVLLRVDPAAGAQTVVSPQGAPHPLFRVPIAVAIAANGDIYVADALGPIFRVDPRSGAQTLISQGNYLRRPQGIAVNGNNIYVTDVATADMNFGIGRVVQVNADTGAQSVLSEGNYLVGPVGIAVEQSGHLIVGDPYTINQDSADLFDGGIIQINKNTGAQKLIARGSGNFVNPRGVALVTNAN